MSDNRRERQSDDGPFQEEEPLARLYQQTKEEESPSHLDAAVLTAARRAVEPIPRTSRVYFLPPRQWAVLLSLAAALLVSIGVVREFYKDITSPVLSTPFASSPAPPESIPRRKELNREEKTSPSEQETRGNTKTKETAETLGKFAPAAPEPSPPSAESQSSGVPEEPAPARGIASQASPEENPIANVEKSEAPMTVQPEEPPTSVARPDAQSLMAPVALDARLEGDKEDIPVETETPPQLKKERFISATSGPGNASAAVGQKSQDQIDVVKDEIPSPEAWISKINKLRRTGKLTEAEASLKKFKARYPAYPVEQFLAKP